ncbi:hypothetical protein SAMN02745163_02362 [Clostridium cavendishii DSM 21758]|uniref:Phosphoesterase n=1 Tax=Clostridium cavendishii DSM 21758 TaxID=1121302 RepID=A0A1M6LF24_9CLOT|nr:metallophosphoesterase [Clostridium cavendishii]SHJ69675.1 hypothetical protein SAMN02745163_02362 [Clostridium cavendishii DSM 21758]
MVVAVVSDTHNFTSFMDKVKARIQKADMLIHLGDNIKDLYYIAEGFSGKIYGVKGNCDFDTKELKEQIIEIEDKKFLITHGDKYGVKYDLNRIYLRACELGVDGVMFGHNHIPSIDENNNIWLINPGSASLPKLSKHTMAFIEIEKNRPIYPYIIEL